MSQFNRGLPAFSMGPMAAPDEDLNRINSLDVLLYHNKVGIISRRSDGLNTFDFAQAYRDTGGFPILSLSFWSLAGGVRKDLWPIRGALPPFFANLFPEDKLRAAMESHHQTEVRPGNDFDLLGALD